MKESKRPTRRSASVEEESGETPPILSSEEKRELILAHARSQSGKDPMQRMTVWGGVMIAMIAVAGGWWWTVGTSVQTTWKKGSPELQTMTEALNEFSRSLQTETEALKEPLTPTDSANAGEYPDLLKAVMDGADQKAKRDDLLSPGGRKAATSTGAAIKTTSTETNTQAIPFIDPTDPGLELDTNASN